LLRSLRQSFPGNTVETAPLPGAWVWYGYFIGPTASAANGVSVAFRRDFLTDVAPAHIGEQLRRLGVVESLQGCASDEILLVRPTRSPTRWPQWMPLPVI
jgi:hypothetical protein